jgi:hypothetical protein
LNGFASWLISFVCVARWNEVPADGRRQATQLLMSWTAQNIANSSEHVNLLRPKLAQTLVLLFMQEFPNAWPTFFDELLSMLSSSGYHKDMFLRVMDTIDEMVVSKVRAMWWGAVASWAKTFSLLHPTLHDGKPQRQQTTPHETITNHQRFVVAGGGAHTARDRAQREAEGCHARRDAQDCQRLVRTADVQE